MNLIINLASPLYTDILELVSILERSLNREAYYNIEDKGSSYYIDISQLNDIYSTLGIVFDVDYVSKTINKYFIK